MPRRVQPMSFSLISCVAAGRDPTVPELFDLAERMWTESATDRSAFAWGQLHPASTDRVVALRSALVAFSGSESISLAALVELT
jgi:hypothetical protein